MKRPTVIRNRTRTEKPEAGEERLLDVLENAELPGWTIYEQPHFNGDRPDFVLVNPRRGVVIIEVKDLQLDNGHYARSDQRTIRVLGSDGRWHEKPNPLAQVQRYWHNMTKLYSRKFLALEARFGDNAYAVIERAIYFHSVSAETARAVCGADRHVRFLDQSHLNAIAMKDWPRSGLDALKYSNDSKFVEDGLLESFIRDLEPWLNPTLYQRDRQAPIILTPEQEPHAVPNEGLRRRLRGVAGGGKTLVLATRAARLLADGKRVLIFTFNITLQHYVRDLVKQQYVGADPESLHQNLVIRYFHNFLEWVADLHDLVLPKVPQGAKAEVVDEILTVRWPAAVRHGIPETAIKLDCVFDAILIDEGQDFTRDWAELCFRFLSPRNEVLLVYDHVQNIYDRDLAWIETDATGLGFRGTPATLKVSRRMPGGMAQICHEVGLHFGLLPGGVSPIELEGNRQAQGTLFGPTMQWVNLYDIFTHEELASRVLQIIREVLMSHHGFHPNDIVVLTDDEQLAISLIKALQAEGFGVAHVFDLSGEGDHFAKRQEKWRFQPTDGMIKVCTVHSYKGWESPCVLLMTGHPGEATFAGAPATSHRNSALLYVALTRLKRRSDGGPSVFFGVNLDPRLEDVGLIFDKYTLG